MITFLVAENDLDIFNEINEICPEQVHYINIEASLDGQAAMQVIVEISKVTIPLLASIIINYINNRKIVIKENGKEITTFLKERLSYEQIKEILLLMREEKNNE